MRVNRFLLNNCWRIRGSNISTNGEKELYSVSGISSTVTKDNFHSSAYQIQFFFHKIKKKRMYGSSVIPSSPILDETVKNNHIMLIVSLSPVSSVADPNFFHPGSLIRIKELKYFYPKNCF